MNTIQAQNINFSFLDCDYLSPVTERHSDEPILRAIFKNAGCTGANRGWSVFKKNYFVDYQPIACFSAKTQCGAKIYFADSQIINSYEFSPADHPPSTISVHPCRVVMRLDKLIGKFYPCIAGATAFATKPFTFTFFSFMITPLSGLRVMRALG